MRSGGFLHLWAAVTFALSAMAGTSAAEEPPSEAVAVGLAERVDALERRVTELEGAIAALRKDRGSSLRALPAAAPVNFSLKSFPPSELQQIETEPPVRIKVGEISAEDLSAPKLLSMFRSVPYFREGTAIGERVFAIRDGSFLPRLGLRNGDIVLGVSGGKTPLGSFGEFLASHLTEPRSFSLVIERTRRQLVIPVTLE